MPPTGACEIPSTESGYFLKLFTEIGGVCNHMVSGHLTDALPPLLKYFSRQINAAANYIIGWRFPCMLFEHARIVIRVAVVTAASSERTRITGIFLHFSTSYFNSVQPFRSVSLPKRGDSANSATAERRKISSLRLIEICCINTALETRCHEVDVVTAPHHNIFSMIRPFFLSELEIKSQVTHDMASLFSSSIAIKNGRSRRMMRTSPRESLKTDPFASLILPWPLVTAIKAMPDHFREDFCCHFQDESKVS